MKLLIEIPEEAKQAFDCAESNDLKASYYDLGGVIGSAIKNGKSLDTVLDKIRAKIEYIIDNTYDSTDYDKSLYNGAYKDGLYEALDIIDTYKAESEEKG